MIFCNATLKHFKEDLSKYEGVNLTFAAIITDVQHRVSKAGKGWAMFTMEDYGDSNEFRIFGEDYLRMKHFLTPNSFLFVRCCRKLNHRCGCTAHFVCDPKRCRSSGKQEHLAKDCRWLCEADVDQQET